MYVNLFNYSTHFCSGLTLAGSQVPTKWLYQQDKRRKLGKKWFNLSPVNNRAGWRVTRNRITNTFLSATSSQAQPHFWLFYLLPTSSLRVWGMGLWAVHNVSSVPLLFPHILTLFQHEVPSTGYSPSQTSPVCILPTGCSS